MSLTYQAAAGTDSAVPAPAGSLAPIPQRRDPSAMRQPGIERRQFAAGEIAGAAERDRRARLGRRLRQVQRGCRRRAAPPMNRPGPSRSSTATAGTFSECCSASRGADLALEIAVEIARRVIAEMAPAVLEHRLRMEDQPVERHARRSTASAPSRASAPRAPCRPCRAGAARRNRRCPT